MTWEDRMINLHPQFVPYLSRAATCPTWVIDTPCASRDHPSRHCLCQSPIFEHLHGWTVAGERVLTAEPVDPSIHEIRRRRHALALAGLRLLIMDGSPYEPGRSTLLVAVRESGPAEAALAPDCPWLGPDEDETGETSRQRVDYQPAEVDPSQSHLASRNRFRRSS